MSFTRWMGGPAGRWLRIVAGIVLVAAGMYVWGVWGLVLAVLGVVAALAGAMNFCLLAPIFGQPLSGKRVRAAS